VKNPAESSQETATKEEARYYTVQSGDTLWDIANKYKGVTVDEIKRLNNIYNSKRLNVGQRIKLSAGNS
jgi:membrane-bound lytic murein transglycosylase D